jgi:hypothetical protein
LNLRPLAPQASALTSLRHVPTSERLCTINPLECQAAFMSYRRRSQLVSRSQSRPPVQSSLFRLAPPSILQVQGLGGSSIPWSSTKEGLSGTQGSVPKFAPATLDAVHGAGGSSSPQFSSKGGKEKSASRPHPNEGGDAWVLISLAEQGSINQSLKGKENGPEEDQNWLDRW